MLSLLIALLAGTPASAQYPDTCLVKGSEEARTEYLLNQLPGFDSIDHIHQLWQTYRNSPCRFDEAFLARWKGLRPLYELGDDSLELFGDRANQALHSLTGPGATAVKQWDQLAQQQKAEGFVESDIHFDMDEVPMRSARELGVCDPNADRCYEIYARLNYQPRPEGQTFLLFFVQISLRCEGGTCELLRWETKGVSLEKPDGTLYKGVSSSSGGQRLEN